MELDRLAKISNANLVARERKAQEEKKRYEDRLLSLGEDLTEGMWDVE